MICKMMYTRPYPQYFLRLVQTWIAYNIYLKHTVWQFYLLQELWISLRKLIILLCLPAQIQHQHFMLAKLYMDLCKM